VAGEEDPQPAVARSAMQGLHLLKTAKARSNLLQGTS